MRTLLQKEAFMQEAEVEDSLETEIWNSFWWAFDISQRYLKFISRQWKSTADFKVGDRKRTAKLWE